MRFSSSGGASYCGRSLIRLRFLSWLLWPFTLSLQELRDRGRRFIHHQHRRDTYVFFLTGATWVGPLILWTDFIFARNHIESATDWIAVWFFVAQVGALLIPLEFVFLKCSRSEIRASLSLSNIRKLLSASHRRYAIARGRVNIRSHKQTCRGRRVGGLHRYLLNVYQARACTIVSWAMGERATSHVRSWADFFNTENNEGKISKSPAVCPPYWISSTAYLKIVLPLH